MAAQVITISDAAMARARRKRPARKRDKSEMKNKNAPNTASLNGTVENAKTTPIPSGSDKCSRIQSSKKAKATNCCGMKAFADANGAVYVLYRGALEMSHRDE